MPSVPQYNHKPLKVIYNPTAKTEPATLKQKDYIITLCQRRKLPIPDNIKSITKGDAAQLLSSMLNF